MTRGAITTKSRDRSDLMVWACAEVKCFAWGRRSDPIKGLIKRLSIFYGHMQVSSQSGRVLRNRNESKPEGGPPR